MYSNLKDSKVGRGVNIYSFCNIYGCTIGDETQIGSHVEIQRGAIIGKNCKISSHSFVCDGVIIEDNVFIGHGVMFINDRKPRSCNSDGTKQQGGDWILEKTTVEKGASVGSNATILCGITIGADSTVGAGSVVTKDVPPNSTVYGNPARIKGN